MASNDASTVYEWEVPDYVSVAIEEEATCLLLEGGIPELDLEGTQSLIFEMEESPLTPGFFFAYVSVIPMQEKFDTINAFYDNGRQSLNIALGLVILVSVLAVTLITFFVLSYLIRRRITEPVDELAAAADEVMQGNLDVEIKVDEG